MPLKSNSICSNCGKKGHEFKSCDEPVTSYGVIMVDINGDGTDTRSMEHKFRKGNKRKKILYSKKYPNIRCSVTQNDVNDSSCVIDAYKIKLQNIEKLRKFNYYRNKISFMMVSRKHSLGFVEFIRGKYDPVDVKAIINLFENMYENEIEMIRDLQFDQLLAIFLNRDSSTDSLSDIYEGKYSAEYIGSKVKFNIIKYGNNPNGLNLSFYVNYIKPKWKGEEWGFPKGRRSHYNEANIECAIREFEEETGCRPGNYNLLDKIEPVSEYLTGTNNVNYKHVYYIALANNNVDDIKGNIDSFEIGQVKWFTYDDAMKMIRPYHLGKKYVLTQTYIFVLDQLINDIYCSD